MKLSGISRRTWIIGTLVALILGLLLLVAAPAANRIASGSTWGTAPDGYRAWYEYMASNGTSVERWQRPLEELLDEDLSDNDSAETDTSATLLVVLPQVLNSSRFFILDQLYDWFEAGNQVVMLSSQQPVTAASFSSQISSDAGAVTIETRRRLDPKQTSQPEKNPPDNQDDNSTDGQLISSTTPIQTTLIQESTSDRPKALLKDEHGAVVWRQNRELGSLVMTTTPLLAANAYAEAPGNLAYLAELESQGGGPIYVDEYIHGYKDSDVVIEEVAGTWLGYLAKTPLLFVVVQAVVLVLIGLLANNRRFGLAKKIPPVEMNNSAAYIQALAGVLHKANNHDFLVETLTRAEQKTLQRALGLGDAPVSLDTLQTAWQQATGRSVAELNVLRNAPKPSLKGESALKDWLQRLQSLHTLASKSAK